MLCSRIVRNHPLPDGNERVAFLCLVEFIERNGYRWNPSPGGDEETVDVIIRLAAGELSEADFVKWVRARYQGGP